MSTDYVVGLAMMAREHRAPHDLGAVIYPPGAMKAEATTVDAELYQLYLDVNASKLAADKKQAFYRFVNEWKDFYVNHSSWTDRAWFSYIEKVQDYRKRGNVWRDALQAAGVVVNAPRPEETHAGVDLSLPSVGKLAAIGGVLAVGVVGLMIAKGR